MVYYSLYIVNKAGSLLYTRYFAATTTKLPSNDRIRMLSTLHSISTIAGKLSPTANTGGFSALDSDAFRFHCFQSATGVSFFLLTDPSHSNVDALLRKSYELYADFVLKNPFYSLDDPIRVDLFDNALATLFES